jgi:hypothetical protein
MMFEYLAQVPKHLRNESLSFRFAHYFVWGSQYRPNVDLEANSVTFGGDQLIIPLVWCVSH